MVYAAKPRNYRCDFINYKLKKNKVQYNIRKNP